MNVEKNSFKFDWNEYVPKKPKFLGIKVFKEISIKNIFDYIDWKPFFNLGSYTEIFLKY